MTLKRRDDQQFSQYLNKLLDEMPLSEPSPFLTDRIMQSLRQAETETPSGSPHRNSNRPWMNGAIAITATVLLIQSGLIGKIAYIASGITQLTDYIHNLSQNL